MHKFILRVTANNLLGKMDNKQQHISHGILLAIKSRLFEKLPSENFHEKKYNI